MRSLGKKIVPFLACVLGVGCVAAPEQESVFSPSARSLTALHKIKLGMTQAEVKGHLTEALVIGYRSSNVNAQQLEPITIPQPYREAVFSTETGTYKVLYYYTGVVKADDMVSEDELTPLIFESDRLVGKGSDELDRFQRK